MTDEEDDTDPHKDTTDERQLSDHLNRWLKHTAIAHSMRRPIGRHYYHRQPLLVAIIMTPNVVIVLTTTCK